METQREKCLSEFKESHLEETPLNWHIWKRAFDRGVNFSKNIKDGDVCTCKNEPDVFMDLFMKKARCVNCGKIVKKD